MTIDLEEFLNIAEVRLPRIGATTTCIALIASRSGNGVVLEQDGEAIEAMVSDCGPRLDDLGLDDAPDGLSIWEGELHCWEVHTPDMHEHEAELEGKFRDLTHEEWEQYRLTGHPWRWDGAASTKA